MRDRSVVVLGAGIVGAAIAHRAALSGARVTVVEAAEPGAGTSGSSLAWINSNRKLPRAYHDFSVRAMHAWRRLAADLGGPGWYLPTGNLAWAVTDDRRADLAATVARLREWGYPASEPDPRTVAGLEPRLRIPPGAYVAYFPAEASVHPAGAIAALLTRARARGARLVENAGPAAFEVAGSRVVAVRLAGGERVHADAYICCAGIGTSDLLEPLGARVPLAATDRAGSAAPGLVATVHTRTPLLSRVVHAPDLSIRPASPAGLRMDAADVNLRVDAATGPASIDRHARTLYGRARRVLAGIPAGAAVAGRLCLRPLPVDGLPVAGWLPAHDNVYLVVGHSGVTLAALLAELTTTEIMTGREERELAPYRPDRFATA